MKDIVATLKNEIQAKSDKILQFEMQLVYMEERITTLSHKLKNNLTKLDMCMILYETVYECIHCSQKWLNIHTAFSDLNTFIIRLEKCNMEQRKLLDIDNLHICMTCYCQEIVNEVTSPDSKIKGKFSGK